MRRSYRCLAHEFTLECDDDSLFASIERLLDSWVEPAASGATQYVLVATPTSDGRHWFSLVRDGDELAVGPDPMAVIDDLVSRISAAAFGAPGEMLLVHAAAISTPTGAGVVLPGQSGSGKTTLVAALVRAGFAYLSDEAAVLDPTSGVVSPFARPLGLKGPARAWFAGRALTNGSQATLYLAPDDLRRGSVSAPCAVEYVIAPRYEAGAPTELTPMSPAEVVVELGQCAMNLMDFGQGGLDALASVARRADGHRLAFSDLAEAVSTVTELTRST